MAQKMFVKMDAQHLDTSVIWHTFQTDYSMKGSEPSMHEKIVAMAMNRSGCRETSRVLGICLNMVLRHLKKIKSSQ